MCRLFGFVATTPRSLAGSLGDEFDEFTALAAVHGDGWGAAWTDPSTRQAAVVSSPQSAAADPRYRQVCDAVLGPAAILHLRWATDGLPVRPENTHPFVAGSYAFAHNGSISPVGQIEELLDERVRADLRGDTDSERYFRFLLQCMDEAGDEEKGIRLAVQRLGEQFPEASLNALLLGERALYVVHHNRGAASPADELRARFGSSPLPRGHESAYFDMAYRVEPRRCWSRPAESRARAGSRCRSTPCCGWTGVAEHPAGLTTPIRGSR